MSDNNSVCDEEVAREGGGGACQYIFVWHIRLRKPVEADPPKSAV